MCAVDSSSSTFYSNTSHSLRLPLRHAIQPIPTTTTTTTHLLTPTPPGPPGLRRAPHIAIILGPQRPIRKQQLLLEDGGGARAELLSVETGGELEGALAGDAVDALGAEHLGVVAGGEVGGEGLLRGGVD